MNDAYKLLRIGLVGLGLREYWNQFEGLEARLHGYLDEAGKRISAPQRFLVNLGLVDSHERALAAGHRCRQDDIDILFVYVTTYALSATVLPVLLRAKVPVILLNLQPAPAIDYVRFNQMESRTAMTGEWLAHCASCPVPEIVNVMQRLDMPVHQVTGMLHNDDVCWKQIDEWLQAAATVKALSHSRLGLLGHYYSGMLDITTDLVQVSGRFGVHVEQLEVEELSALRREVDESAKSEMVRRFHDFFAIEEGCDPLEVERAAATAVALDRLVRKHDLDLMAYYYRGVGIAENENVMSSIIPGASLLTGHSVPIAGEYEVKNAIAMKILDLMGVGGSFTEYYAMDFDADLVLMGHDGPGHVGIAQDKIKLRPLQVYHGKVGRGLSVEMSVRHGSVTLLSIVEDRERGFSFLASSAESVPGDVLEIGNTNSRYRFRSGAREFVEKWNAAGPAHHCAIGVGNVLPQLQKISSILNFHFHCIG
ncbi:arabinose isomerase [Silvibacterium acidisoli]|uniref:arabinose isomerase n=1 Tax=Acidobacteriaceae bacterium ZG23-2 TaxID=2883246 RepID=UPI00406CA479